MNKLGKYVGRIVRLNAQAFQEVSLRARRSGGTQENFFLVATVNREMRKLICYGADMRIAVGASDVVLV